MSLEVTDPRQTGGPDRLLDVYEFYWAPLTQGKASFIQVLSWFRKTTLTPLKRFAFNLPLVMQKNGNIASVAWFLNEVWRVIWITLVGVAIAGLVGFLVERSAQFFTELQNAVRAAIPTYETWTLALSDASTALIFLGLVVGLFAILLSIPEQIRDLNRLRHLRPGFSKLLWRSVRRTFNKSSGPWFQKAMASFGGFREAIGGARRWDAEIKARRRFLWLSILAVAGFGIALSWAGRGRYPFTDIVANVFQQLGWQGIANLGLIALLIGAGWVFKAVFVDYLGDVALYVTADETSAFYRTRSEILHEASRKLRYLLRNYRTVALVGHSLGSVIAYDTINRLRLETQLPPSASTTASVEEVLTNGEFERLKTFITFGSPLDKVLYFFRQRIKPYETVRAHILHELHGFRRLPDLLTSDETIVDQTMPPNDTVRWINFYSHMDPVGARLDFYMDVDNRSRWYWIWGKAHVSYWYDQGFYRAVVETLDQDGGITS